MFCGIFQFQDCISVFRWLRNIVEKENVSIQNERQATELNAWCLPDTICSSKSVAESNLEIDNFIGRLRR